MSDTWEGSLLGENILQVDGAADDNTEGYENARYRGRKTGERRTRKRSSKVDNTQNTHDNFTRTTTGNFTTIMGKGGFSKTVTCSHEGWNDNTESPNEKVWPQKGRAIRTYSKHSLSAMRKEKSFQKATETQNDGKAQPGVYAERDDDESDEEAVFRLFLSESSDSDGSNLDEVRESFYSREVNEIPRKMLKEKNNRRTENFASLEDKTSVERKLRSDRKDWHQHLEHKKQVCFEINDGRKDETIEGDLSSRKMNIASEENSGSGVKKGVRERPYSSKKEQNTSQSCVAVTTKYFNSPDKSSKDAEKGDVVELTSQILPHCSKDKESDVGTFTIRKRKLAVTDKKNPERSEKQRADVGAALDVVRGAMSNLKVLLEDVAQTPAMDLKFKEARTRLRNKREHSDQNFTRIIEKQSSSPVRTETLSQKRLSVRSRGLEKSPLSKNVSPKRKEERMKKYGELPVLIVKSPRKTNSFCNSQSSENATGIPLNQGDLSVLTSNVNCTGTESLNTGPCSPSRNWTRGEVSLLGQTRHAETEEMSDVYASGNKTRNHENAKHLSRRMLSLKSIHESREQSKNETSKMFSLQRKGRKRKLVIATEKGSQLTPTDALLVASKKRKLSFALEVNRSRPILGKINVDEALEAPVEKDNSLAVDLDAKPQFHGQQVKMDMNSGNRSQVGIKQLNLSKGQMDDVTCVPSSPGGCDSDDEPSAGETCTHSSPLTTKGSLTICKSYRSSEFSLRHDSIRDKVAYLPNDLQCTLQQNFPEEKGSELLANALFNMSFPSPLPWEEECNSPPDPSTPLGTACDGYGVEDQRPNTLDENCSRFVDENSFQCLETTKRKSPISFSDKQATRPSCTYISFSNNGMPLEVSSVGTCCPQLGETQSQLETMDDEIEDQSNLQRGQSKSCDTERITQAVTNEEIVASKRNIDEENRCLTPNTELAILENDPCVSRAVCEDKPSESTNVSTAHFSESTTTKSHALRTELDSTDCDEAVEMSSGNIETKDFLLRLTSVDNSGEALDKSDVRKIASSLNEDGDIQICNAFTENKNLSITQPSESGKSDKGKQISSPEELSNKQPRNALIEGVVTDTTEGLVVEPADQSGERKAIPKVPNTTHNQPNFTASSNDGTASIVAIKPLKQPPNADELIASLKEHGLPHCKYQAPFCSNPDDIPACPR